MIKRERYNLEDELIKCRMVISELMWFDLAFVTTLSKQNVSSSWRQTEMRQVATTPFICPIDLCNRNACDDMLVKPKSFHPSDCSIYLVWCFVLDWHRWKYSCTWHYLYSGLYFIAFLAPSSTLTYIHTHLMCKYLRVMRLTLTLYRN